MVTEDEVFANNQELISGVHWLATNCSSADRKIGEKAHSLLINLLKEVVVDINRQQWISVKEKLPDLFEEYLCISIEDNCPVHKPYIAIYDKTNNEWRKPFSNTQTFPTHWATMPKPPIVDVEYEIARKVAIKYKIIPTSQKNLEQVALEAINEYKIRKNK